MCIRDRSFSAEQLSENIEALLKYVIGLKPNTSKGVYMQSMSLTGTMMPAISVAV